MTTRKYRLWKSAQTLAWMYVLIVFAVGFYGNHSFPHGPVIPTGEFNCANDGRGPCAEDTYEDTRGLDVPDWVKFFRENDSGIQLSMLVVAIFALYAGSKREEEIVANNSLS